MKISRILASLSLAACLACAHQVVAKSVDGHYEMGFWAHDGFEKYENFQVLGAQAYNIDGKVIETGIDFSKNPAQILTAKKPALIVSNFDAKYWTKTEKGYVNKPLSEVNGVAFASLKSIKIGKTYFEYSEALSNPLGLELEVTPLLNPLTLKVGDVLPVLVTYQGKPLAGAGFETKNEDLEQVTNDFGIAFIKIKEAGLNIIAAKHSYPFFLDRQAQKILIQSSISFEIK